MLVKEGLEACLQKYAERYKIIKRDVLRNYGKRLRTVRNPYGYDIDTVNRKIRLLQQSGKLIGLDCEKERVGGNGYIVYFLAV